MAKRVTSIGGQALLEGILMVGPKKNVAAFVTKPEILQRRRFPRRRCAKNTPF